MPFSLPANYNPGDQYSNVAANNVAAAINSLVNGLQTAYVATNETTASTTYTDLTTTTDQVTVTVGQSGLVLVIISAYITTPTGASTQCMSFALSGANTLAASDTYSIAMQGYGGGVRLGAVFPLPGLAPGATTFKAKYNTNAGTANFSLRRITVIPFP
ncbi:MAG TPA: hypothetical protein VMS84_07505 [Mycobacterium sp.]|jgi:hypothetical protein|nr:hypothetical protein [Mycobacterium sp.]